MNEPDYEQIAVAAGWVKTTFGNAIKWYNPTNDDGSCYLDHPRHLRYLSEDHDLLPDASLEQGGPEFGG